MKKKKVAVAALTAFSCFALLSMPMKADAGRFRAGSGIQNQSSVQQQNMLGGQQGPGIGFVDADGDGINDNFVDADGDGICDLTGLPVGSRGHGFVDANGDGINDNFIDADGDGICDRRQ
jgi:hypothetical protein